MVVPERGFRSRLLGRAAEAGMLQHLLAEVRAGRSQALVLRGAPGVGKSALLEELAANAAGCRVVRITGVESEVEMPFAGLHQLCAPLLDQMENLPEPQRQALQIVFGVVGGNPPDRFLVGLAVLSLLSEAGETEPVVAIVDDAQWLDPVSAQVLAFVARRLMADTVGLVFAVRDPCELTAFDPLPTHEMRGLAERDAQTLLDAARPGPLDDRVRRTILAEAGGNPLAIQELARGPTPAQLAGGFALPDKTPLEGQIEESFVRRVRALSPEAQLLILVASAEPTGDASLVWRAADLLAIPSRAGAELTATGLVDLDLTVRFRHSLVRSAVYRSADGLSRRRVHGALGEATDPDADADRRAWHRGHSASEPDEQIARDLERSAKRARSRGGAAAAAAFLERATRLTPDPVTRAARALEAAQAKFDAADVAAAHELLELTESAPLSEQRLASVARLRAHIAFAHGRGVDAAELLIDAARQLETLDVAMARETYLEALTAATFMTPFGEIDLREVATVTRAAPPGPAPGRPVDLLLDGLSILLTDGYAAGVPVLRRALVAFAEEEPEDHTQVTRWLALACPVAQEVGVHQLWDFEAWEHLATRTVQRARETGALALLPVGLMYLAGVKVYRGDFASAAAMLEEGDSITTATGFIPVSFTNLVLAAWRGDPESSPAIIEMDVEAAKVRGESITVAVAGFVSAILYNGLGRYDDALTAARLGSAHDHLGFTGWALIELVEAAARTGSRHEALDALARLEERTVHSGTAWGLGVLACARAVTAEGPSAEDLFLEAVDLLGTTPATLHLARTHLLFGEWLRREKRRLDARVHLRAAHETFARVGATAYAERARRELAATGERAQPRALSVPDALTAQEAQIAKLSALGHTNREIGGQLFISARTVEYHLGKVYSKLHIASRRELAASLSADDLPVA